MNKRQSKELEKMATILLLKGGYDANGKKLKGNEYSQRVFYDNDSPPWKQEKHG